MDVELDAASAFLASYLHTGTATFSAKLAAVLAARYDGHWHPADPERGSGYRALIRTPASLDSALVAAAADAGIARDELERALAAGDRKVALGNRWTLWVDPGCVSLRVERGEGGAGRDGQFIEIYGKLPESLRNLAVPLATLEAAAATASSNIAPPVEQAAPASPTKRSRAIQIVAPPGGRGALQAMTNAALQPESPFRNIPPGVRSTALLASPLIIPPTPVRPLPIAEADVFSPSPAGSLLGPPRSPSPGSGSSTSTGSKSYSLSPSTYRPSSPLGKPVARRSSSRGSSISSLSAESSDGETSCTDSLFSASGDSTASVASSIHAAAAQAIWKGLDAKSRDIVDGDGFRIPALPPALGTQSHSRGSSMSSLIPPPSPSSRTLSPSSSSTTAAGGRSLPGSPTKPRRRGVRGGQSHRSESTHSHHSSISSITSLGSTAIPSTPSLGGNAELAPSPAVTPSGRSRTETSSSAQTATEYSNGLVKVLGGGVLLGCAKGSSSARTPGSVGPNGEDGSRRRRRERGRGGRGGAGANGHANGGDRSGATSPAYGGYPAPPASPVWAPVGVNLYAHHPQAYYGHSPMQA